MDLLTLEPKKNLKNNLMNQNKEVFHCFVYFINFYEQFKSLFLKHAQFSFGMLQNSWGIVLLSR